MLADDVQGLPEVWGCLCLVGGHEGAEQPVVELGVEDGELDPVWSKDVLVGVLDPPDESCDAEPSQVISHLARGVVGVQQAVEARRLLLVMPVAAVRGGGERAGQGGDPRIAEPEGRGPSPIVGEGWVRDPLEGWAREDGCLAGALSFQYAPVDGAGFALKLVQVGQPGVAGKVAGAVDDASIRIARPIFRYCLTRECL